MVLLGVVLLMLLVVVWQIAKHAASSPRRIPTQRAALAVLPSSVNFGDSGGLTAWILPLTVRRPPDSIRIRLRSDAGLPCLRWARGSDFVGYLGDSTALRARRVQERADIAFRPRGQTVHRLEYIRTFASY